MRFSHIKVFHAVVKFGSFSKAADYLRISQPAVSQQIKALEETVGKRLFLREGRNVFLTDAGRKIMYPAFQIISLMNDLEFRVSAGLRLQTGPISIGFTSPFFLKLIACFRDRFPEVELHIQFGNTTEMHHHLAHFKVDAAFITQMESAAGFSSRTFFQQRIIAFVERNHPWARRESITLAELCGAPLVHREKGSLTRSLFETEIAARGLELPEPAMTVGSREILKEAVASGIGAGYIFDVEFGQDRRLRAVPIADADMTADQALVCLPNFEKSQLVRELQTIISGFDFSRDACMGR